MKLTNLSRAVTNRGHTAHLPAVFAVTVLVALPLDAVSSWLGFVLGGNPEEAALNLFPRSFGQPLWRSS